MHVAVPDLDERGVAQRQQVEFASSENRQAPMNRRLSDGAVWSLRLILMTLQTGRLGRAALLMFGVCLGTAALEVTATLIQRARPAKDGYAPVRGRGSREPLNALGYRDTEHQKAKPQGVRRIVFIGDSFTHGVGIQFDDTYGKRVERTLALKHAGTWESIVLAVPGIGTEEETAIVENEALDFQPDILVLGYVLNDAEETDAAERRRAIAWTQAQEAKRHPAPWRRSALLSLVADRLDAARQNRLRIENHRALYREDAPGFRKARNGIERIARRCRDRGVRFIGVIFPLFANPLDAAYPFEEIHRKVAGIFRAAGAGVVDLLPYYRDMDWRLLVVEGERDEHPNELAHRIAAQALASAIESSLSEQPFEARVETRTTADHHADRKR